MAHYQVTMYTSSYVTTTVDAESEEQAKEIMDEMFCNGEFTDALNCHQVHDSMDVEEI